MNKKALARQLSIETGIGSKKSEEVVDSIVDIIIKELNKDNKVSLSGFGTFSTYIRYARGGVNPRKPSEKITIPETRVAKFKTGKRLKDTLKGKR